MGTALALQREHPLGFSRLFTLPAVDPQFFATWDFAKSRDLCRQLELGDIVFFSPTPIEIPRADRELLLGRRQSSSAYHKNIAFRPGEDRVTGLDKSEQAEASELRRILRRYSQYAVEFLSRFLLPYAGKWKLDLASFRPVEEQGRIARVHARNDLVHFDSFPTRPTNGARILRFFTNINPTQNRVWITSHTFESFGAQLAKTGQLACFRRPLRRAVHAVGRVLYLPGFRRPPYDQFMHRLHNAMKQDAALQDTMPKHRWQFPPNSSWLVFTDCVSHAVVCGQYALEQTFLIPQSALVDPQRSPLAILESLAAYTLTI